jgi:hypothetical protein
MQELVFDSRRIWPVDCGEIVTDAQVGRSRKPAPAELRLDVDDMGLASPPSS